MLFAINLMNFFDRQILGAVGEQIRREWSLGDTALGALGTAFTLLYAFVGVPFGRLADRAARKYILAGGVFLWSLLTAASGLARNFWELFAVRLGVGVGEASCAPAAISLIGDLYRVEHRARATATFMMGLPIGLGLSFLVGSSVAQRWGWRRRSSSPRRPASCVPWPRCSSRNRRGEWSKRTTSARSVAPARRTGWSSRFRRCGGSSCPARCTTSTCTRSARSSARS